MLFFLSYQNERCSGKTISLIVMGAYIFIDASPIPVIALEITKTVKLFANEVPIKPKTYHDIPKPMAFHGLMLYLLPITAYNGADVQNVTIYTEEHKPCFVLNCEFAHSTI